MVTEKVNPTLTHVSRVAVLLGFGAYFGTLPQHMICVFGTCFMVHDTCSRSHSFDSESEPP